MKKSFILRLVIFLLIIGGLFSSCSTESESDSINYTVTFNPKNGDPISKIKVPENEYIKSFPYVYRSNWSLDGWFTEDGIKVTTSTRITSNITLTARWKGTVYFYDGQNENPTKEEFIEGSTVTPILADGYMNGDKKNVFLYWSENPNATESSKETDEYDFSKKITTSPVKLYAIYGLRDAHTITLNYNYSEAESTEIKIGDGESLNNINLPVERANYDFNYWYLEDETNPNDYKIKFDSNTPITSDIKLKAKWTIKINIKDAYNGLFLQDNNFSDEDLPTEEELDGITISYKPQTDSTYTPLKINKIEFQDDYLCYHVDYLYPETKTKYNFLISNGITSIEKNCDIYPFLPVENLSIIADKNCVELTWDNIEGYKNYTIMYYPTNNTSDIKYEKYNSEENTSGNLIIEDLESNTEYTFDIYTLPNPFCDKNAIYPTKASIKQITEITVKQSDYLMIMYMSADNNLNDPIYMDMNEVEYGLYQIRNSDNSAKNEYAAVNVVALWDGGNSSTNQLGDEYTHIYEIGIDSGNDTEYTTSSGCVLSKNTKDLTHTSDFFIEENLGKKETLIKFLNWVNEHYKAENVILQFSNHGGGPRSAPRYLKTKDGFTFKIDNSERRAMCWDEGSYLSGESFLKTSDVSDALQEAGYGKDNKLDMLLMDVCLGASIEDSYQFKDYANYMIASPNNIAGMGMNYVDMIKSFKKTATIETIGKQLINDFRAYYTWSASKWNQYCKELSEIAGTTLTLQQIQFYSMLGISTLTMIDLTKIDDLENSITELSQFILNNKSKNLSGLYYDESGNVVNEESANTTPIPYIDLLKDYVRMSSLTGNSLYYMGTYSWLFDIGYMIDTFTYVASETINNSPNPNSWPELVSTCEKVKQSLENTIVKAWRDSPYIDSTTGTELNFYDVLNGSHYGLTISGETVADDGETLISGKCPSFYKEELKFGEESAWSDLLIEWFGI